MRFVSILERAARRLAWMLAVIVGVGTIAFALERGLPGDPVRVILGPQAPPDDVVRARRIYGLDESVAIQYYRFWERLAHIPSPNAKKADHASCAEPIRGLHVDLGMSYRGKPVAKLIAERAPRSFELAVAALLLQLLFGLGVGIFSAKRAGSLWDQLGIGATILGVSAPTFVIGLSLQYLFAHRLGWLPIDGYGETTAQELASLVLPAMTLGLYGAALYARLSRDEVSRALAEDYIKTARAKGAGEARVLFVHALRNAFVPIATLIALDLGALIGGAIVTEKLFRWPGMGALAVDAMVNRDGPVIFGTVLFGAAVLVLASALVDVLAAWIDPRQRQ